MPEQGGQDELALDVELGNSAVHNSWYFHKDDNQIESEEAFIEAVANGGYDAIVCDSRLRVALPRTQDFHIIDFPHFAVSGRLLDEVK